MVPVSQASQPIQSSASTPQQSINRKALLASLLVLPMTMIDAGLTPQPAQASSTRTVSTRSIRQKNPSNLSYLKQSTMLGIFGAPGPKHRKGTGGRYCGSVTNAKVKRELITADVGPFRVTGLKPAISTYKRIFAKVKREKPSLYRQLGTAGSLCQRLIGSRSWSYSNHAWGSAIDVKINGKLDAWGDGRTMIGLKELAPYFHAEGFYWGAGFSKEDSMHFEPSDQLMRKWYGKGGSPRVNTPKAPPCKGKNSVLKPSTKSLTFKRGQTWKACGYRLSFQHDGNLVMYGPQGPLWATGTHTKDAQMLAIQSDGNVVLYSGSGRALWASNTQGNPGAFLAIQTDGNLVVYSSSGRPLFSTRTHGGTQQTLSAASRWRG